MLTSKANFTSPEFEEHVSIYRFEIEKYLTLADIRCFLKSSKAFLFAVPIDERSLTMYFLAQHMLYKARWLEYLLEKQIN